MQFSAVMLPYIIRFVLSTNLYAIVSWLLLSVLRSLDIKNKNRIGNRGDFCGIPVGVGIGSLLYPLNTILVMRPIKKA